MGKPLNKKFFGDPSDPGTQLSVDVWFTGEGSAETGWIVRQRGTGIYEITNGPDGLTERLKLQNAAPTAGGQASMTVNPFGTSGVTATATATQESGVVDNPATVTLGGSGYLSAPVVTITGAGTGATATATLTGDAVSAVTVTSGGSGYTEPSVVIAVPTGGDLEFVKTILSHQVKTFANNVYDWDAVTSASVSGQGDLPIS